MSVPVLRNLVVVDQRTRRQGRPRSPKFADFRTQVRNWLTFIGEPVALPEIVAAVMPGSMITRAKKNTVRKALAALEAEGRVRCLDRGNYRKPSIWEAAK